MRATRIRGAMGNEGQPPATLHSKGCADVAIGVERLAKELPNLAFVPLQTEWLDIAVEKSQRTAPLVREIRKIAESESFRSAIDAIEGCEATNTGPSSTRARRATRVAGCGRGDTLLRCPHLSIGFPYSNCINSCISRFPSA